MKLSLRAKTMILFVAVTAGPVVATVLALVRANDRPIHMAEDQLQSAVVNEVAQEPIRPLVDLEKDAVAVAAVLSRAVSGAVRDEDAIESVRALIGSREHLSAVRLEVPESKVSTVIRWATTDDVVPESTPALRAQADAQGFAVSVLGREKGVVVARIRTPPGVKAPPGYVTVRANLPNLDKALEEIAVRRCGGDVSLLLATSDRRLIASYNTPSVEPGADLGKMPFWRMLPTEVAPDRSYSVNSFFPDGAVPMVGAIQTIPGPGWVAVSWRSQDTAYRALADMRRLGFLIAVIAPLLAALVGFFAAGSITAPILSIVGQARLIAQRKWREVSLSTDRSDEIGELTRGLGEMARDLEQGEHEVKLRGDLSRFMSKQLVDAIVKGEHSLSPGGKRMAVSVIFADVVGFTPLAESRDAEQIVALLNELFSMLTEIVFRHGGTVDKFIGDCIMAVWGAPVPQADHAFRALSAAEDMMRFLETANEGWREKYNLQVRLGIGVNSGEALVGNVGSDKRMEYTVIGDVVNVAARLEAIAQPNQVLVSEATHDLAGSSFALRKLGTRKLTGRKTETGVYELEAD